MKDMLHERDWNFILETIYAMNTEEDLHRIRRIALESLFVLIPSDQIMICRIEKADQLALRCTDYDTVGSEARYMDKFLSGAYDEDPYFRYCSMIKETKCFRDSDIMSNEYRESTRVFKEIYSKQGIYYGMRSYLAYKGEIIANLSFFNSKQRGDFSDRDLHVLELLAPHIALRLGYVMQHSKANAKKKLSSEACARWGLTLREQEISNLLIEGCSDDEIADSLFIAKSTFRKHLYNIYQKIDVNNRVQLYTALTKEL